MNQDWTPITWNKPSVLARSLGKPFLRKKLTPQDSDDPTPPVPISRNLRVLIQNARTAKGFTQKQLATKLNLPASILNGYEAGTAVPDNNVIQRISKVLGVNLGKVV
jgi:ribosome-binding protein aMBF1 (putative translation factor)